MSDTKNTGGPEFPFQGVEWTESPYGNGKVLSDVTYQGMTMRDYFAAKVIGGIFANLKTGNPSDTSIQYSAAREAYEIADAMLKAREQ
jgi:hypothetical protein